MKWFIFILLFLQRVTLASYTKWCLNCRVQPNVLKKLSEFKKNIKSLTVSSVNFPAHDALKSMLPLNKMTPVLLLTVIGAATLSAFTMWIDKIMWTPSRTYNKENNTVAREYDAWEQEGILEYYWGEHIHLGYYPENDRPKYGLPPRKNFIEAKYDFIDKMLQFGQFDVLGSNNSNNNIRILDVGCGIGGTTRYLAKKFGPRATVIGITLSPNQARRAATLALQQNITNAHFLVMDALNMTAGGKLIQANTINNDNDTDTMTSLNTSSLLTTATTAATDDLASCAGNSNTYDYVWACESGEHMPDKELYVREMVRVLKPGGRIVIATWCQRDNTTTTVTTTTTRSANNNSTTTTIIRDTVEAKPFNKKERRMLDFLYSEWTHPYFISIRDYHRILQQTELVEDILTEDWTAGTIASWLHSIWVGVFDPTPVVKQPRLWYKTFRDGLTLVRMHQAFASGLMQYGMMTAVKKQRQQQYEDCQPQQQQQHQQQQEKKLKRDAVVMESEQLKGKAEQVQQQRQQQQQLQSEDSEGKVPVDLVSESELASDIHHNIAAAVNETEDE